MTATGIHGYAVYVPRLRMPRDVIAAQLGWANRQLGAQAQGARSVGNWDEDAVTFAVAAARGLVPSDRSDAPAVDAIVFASTTMPFVDRSNAGLIAEAIGLPAATRSDDVSGSLRAAVSALANAENSARAGLSTLVVGADRRGARPGSLQEMTLGDAGAAVTLGPGDGIARFVGHRCLHHDFVDHYRTADRPTDYLLEERWVRDVGILDVVPRVLRDALDAAGWDAASLSHLVLPFAARHARRVAAAIAVPRDALVGDLSAVIGDSGTAHPLVMLAAALERARPGDRLGVVGFGQGCDAMLFEATEAIASYASPAPLAPAIDAGIEEKDYLKLPVFSRQIELDQGMRAEADKRTAMSAYFRKHEEINRMMGSRCVACGQMHYPRARVCVHCAAVDDMEDVCFADFEGRVKTFTEDWLAATPNPPLCYGNVRFAPGGNALLEMTDCPAGTLAIGTPVTMAFRIKDFDERRGFRRYCWKPVPMRGAPESGA